MRKTFASNVLGVLVLGAAAAAVAKETSLVPPAQSTRESRQRDVSACISQARADIATGKPLDGDAAALLRGHRTEGFIREGRPGVNSDLIPTPSASLFVGRSGLYGPTDVSDRYIVCLLKRGYTWPGSPGDSADSSSPRDTEPAKKPSTSSTVTAEEGRLSSPKTAATVQPATAQPEITSITLWHNPQGIAFTPGAVWVAYGDERKKQDSGVFPVDPNTNQIVTAIPTGKESGGAATGEGAVWISNAGESSVSRIDPDTNRAVATIRVGKNAFGLDFGEGSVWVTNLGSNSVSRIDPKTNAVIATIPVGKRQPGSRFQAASFG